MLTKSKINKTRNFYIFIKYNVHLIINVFNQHQKCIHISKWNKIIFNYANTKKANVQGRPGMGRIAALPLNPLFARTSNHSKKS